MLQNNPENDPLAEKLIDSGIAYKGSFLQLHKDTVKTPDGVVTTREYLHHPGASMIIPMFEDGTVILERQYRHPLRRSFLEFPAGKLNPGESPFDIIKMPFSEVLKQCLNGEITDVKTIVGAFWLQNYLSTQKEAER